MRPSCNFCLVRHAGMCFLTRRLQFQSLLKSSQSGLDSAQYLRLMALASADILLGFPVSLYFLISNSLSLQPWGSWSDVHFGFSYIGHITADELGDYFGSIPGFLLSRWLFPVMAFIFFLFFGVAEDATAEYLRWYVSVKRLLRISSTERDTQ